MKISKIAQLTWEIALLPPDSFDQNCPVYRENACCVGAHLAGILDVSEGFDSDFHRGADEFARILDVSRAHVTLLLRQAGAPHDPFGIQDWEIPVADVWAKLRTIEEFPPIQNTDFSRCDLSGADMSYYDFSGSNFFRAYLGETQMLGATFLNCCFDEACMERAKVAGADFEGATFNLTDVAECYLHEAKNAPALYTQVE